MRKGQLNRYYIRIYPENPRKHEKTCYTRIIVATSKSFAIKRGGDLAYRLGIEARQISVVGVVLPKSKYRFGKLIKDYIEKRQVMQSGYSIRLEGNITI